MYQSDYMSVYRNPIASAVAAKTQLDSACEVQLDPVSVFEHPSVDKGTQ